MTPSKCMCSTQYNNFTIIKTHAIEDITQVVSIRLVGTKWATFGIRETSVRSYSRWIQCINTARAPWDGWATHFLDGGYCWDIRKNRQSKTRHKLQLDICIPVASFVILGEIQTASFNRLSPRPLLSMADKAVHIILAYLRQGCKDRRMTNQLQHTSCEWVPSTLLRFLPVRHCHHGQVLP